MATLQEILENAGTLENAERVARFLSDNNPEYLMDLQLVLSAQGKFDEAWDVSNQATNIYPNDHRVAFNRGWLVMQRGDLLGGFKLMDRGRFVKIWGNSPLQTDKPMWDGKQDISGKAVLFYCEAGLGDEIVYVRFIKQLVEQNVKIVIACDSSLMGLFSRIDGISAVVIKEAATAIYHDYWIPSMSIVSLCNITYKTLLGKPYLCAHLEYMKKWKNIIDSKNGAIKVGIRWSGNPQFEYDQHRSVPAEQMVELANKKNVKFYSLQRDEDLIYLPDNITDLSKLLETWEDTAAAISSLDLVITSCTSIAHLAAALGVLTWVVVPIMPYYIWVLPGEISPWYNSARIFRQKRFGNWDDPIKEIKKALEVLINNKV